MTTLCVIPVRKGSKRLPGKNRMELCGTELWLHAVGVAEEVMGPEDEIVVSVGGYSEEERQEMAALLPEGGRVHLRPRPEALAGDNARIEAVLMYHVRDDHEMVLLLNPTSPLRSAQSVRETLVAAKHVKGCAVTVAPVRAALHGGVVHADADGTLEWVMGRRGPRPQSHEVGAPLSEHGAAFVSRPAVLRRGLLLEPPIAAVVTDEMEAIDVDTQWDFHVATMAMCQQAGAYERLVKHALGQSTPNIGVAVVAAEAAMQDDTVIIDGNRMTGMEACERGLDTDADETPPSKRGTGGDK